MTIITKSGQRVADSYDFVLSTEMPDRVGDVVKIDGLDTKDFEQNPIALYMHNHQEPIGAWSNLRKSNGALIGSLNLAYKGTSKLIDFAHSMISQGMLKAVSVSFMPIDYVKNANGKGLLINKSSLLEVSLVTIPMNPQALMIAKSFDFSDQELNALFLQVKCDQQQQTAFIVKRQETKRFYFQQRNY